MAKEKHTRITTGDLKDEDIKATDIGPGAVDTSELADSAVTSPKIASGEVGSPEIADGEVDTSELADNSVVNTKSKRFAQRGSATAAAGGAYVVPAKPYGDSDYHISLDPKDTDFSHLYVDHQAPGSFEVVGSPVGYYIWRTYGPGTA